MPDDVVSGADRQFQQEVREWLATAWPQELGDKQARSALGKLGKDDLVRWQKKLAARGWAAVNQPLEHGDAGSALASLKTRAEDVGDQYLVNGVKTWTTMAQYAEMMFCLARTSQEPQRELGRELQGTEGEPGRRTGQGVDLCKVPARVRARQCVLAGVQALADADPRHGRSGNGRRGRPQTVQPLKREAIGHWRRHCWPRSGAVELAATFTRVGREEFT